MTKLEINGRQLSAARALLGLHQRHIAEHLQCTHTVISMMEHDRDLPGKSRVVAFFEKRGVEFIRDGVRLRRAS